MNCFCNLLFSSVAKYTSSWLVWMAAEFPTLQIYWYVSFLLLINIPVVSNFSYKSLQWAFLSSLLLHSVYLCTIYLLQEYLGHWRFSLQNDYAILDCTYTHQIVQEFSFPYLLNNTCYFQVCNYLFNRWKMIFLLFLNFNFWATRQGELCIGFLLVL